MEMELKWTRFTRRMVGVLGISILGVGSLCAVFFTLQARRAAMESLSGKAQSVARFTARAAFVPLSLESIDELDRAVSPFLEDRDIVFVRVSDSQGRVRLERAGRGDPKGGRLESEASILPREAPAASAIGRVRVGISMARARREARLAVWKAAASTLAVVAAALLAGALLIRGMTKRLRDLVGEARMAEELRRSNEELESFAFAASHDLQEPLRKIRGFSELLAEHCDGRLDEESGRYIGLIVDGAVRMQELIDGLLQYSRAGRGELRRVPVDMNRALESALSDLEFALKDSGAQAAADPLPTLPADPALVESVFRNLVGNALKFRGKELPRVHVGARRRGGEWEFAVRDNGIGIHPRDYDKLFRPFQRLHSRKEYPGTGIGLALCRKIMDKHGGRIWVESEPGRGTTFRFTLPAQ